VMFINLAPLTYKKRCGACGERGHTRAICPEVPYNGETLEERRKRQAAALREWHRNKWAQNKERGQAANRRNYEKHAEKRIASVTAYRGQNPDKVSGWQANYWANNGERVNAEKKIIRARAYQEDPKGMWIKETFRAAQSRARKRGLPFDKEIPALELPDICPVLGIKIIYHGLTGRHYSTSPSLDRIRPELGYVASNVRVISNRANILKNNATLEEMRLIISYMEKCL
jgi:hypothetical protein